MRNLVVCCDGTWNTPDQEKNDVPAPTNVRRFYNAVADATDGGRPQLRYYHPGVGTDGNWWHRLRGGAFGHGLNQNIMSAYRWLGAEYRPGDRIWLVGFSRGAYTARSLGGWICSCGLLDLRRLGDPAQWERIERCFERGYRKKKKDWRKDSWKLHAGDAKDGQVGIWFVGVWDTVGALGIPDDLAVLNVLDDRGDFVFHDTKLSDKVTHARHALAIDEERGSFSPTVWKNVATRRNVEQVWFAGCHSDVGGGYVEAGLSDITLKWMFDEAETAGLAFRDGMREQLRPDPRGVVHDSLKGFYEKLRTSPRSVPEMVAGAKSDVHVSVLERQGSPPITQAPYQPTRTLAKGESTTLPIYAREKWNRTGLFLRRGAKYELTAKGEWLDKTIPAGPQGTKDGRFHPREAAYVIGSIWGGVESLFQKVSGNDRADFVGTRRHEEWPWFALIGCIANSFEAVTGADGSVPKHEAFLIGKKATYTPKASGYLFGYANDAWHFYGNNRGRVELTVRRVS